MVNQQKHKVDTKAIAEWIHDKIHAGEIRLIKLINPQKKRAQSQHNYSNKNKLIDKLPPLSGPYS